MSQALEDWIGRTRNQTAVLEVGLARRFAAAVGAPLEVEATFPPLGHWAYFTDVVGPSELGPDGHPHRGLFMPPVELPRRMFASAEFQFERPLTLGQGAELDTTITDIRHRDGRSGRLTLVEVVRRLAQRGVARIIERQTIVYREAGEPTAAVAQSAAAGDGEVWRPTSVDLFRFSAATFNSHRIHYDSDYVRGVEGYPDLVVHGPFTASRLFDLASRLAGAPLKTFSFRAMAPLFVDQPVRLRAGEAANTVVAVRCDGAEAMSASFEA
ncbi:MAG: MaoC family dehydratase N-terminal domain-containing protein [Caulobacterales bacterium]